MKLQQLVTLGCGIWPKWSSRTYVDDAAAEMHYIHQLQRLAQRIFISSDRYAKGRPGGLGDRSRLFVLAFGGNGKTPFESEDYYVMQQVIFARGEQTDPYGNTSVLAIQTSLERVQSVEPETTILSEHVDRRSCYQ